MKNSRIWIALILVWSVQCAKAQNTPKDEIPMPTTVQQLDQTFDNYVDDSKYFVPSKITDEYNKDNNKLTKYSAQINIDALVETHAYNPKMLNMFIANNIGSYVTSSSDLSLQKYYAILESGDGSLFLGGNFSWKRRDKIDRVGHVTNIGLKAKAENNFATLFGDDGKPTAELGINLKHTYVFRGKIKYDPSHKTNIAYYRDNYLKQKFAGDLADYTIDTDNNTELEATINANAAMSAAEKTALIQAKYIELYEEIAEAEEKYITDNNQFNSISACWVTVESYIPLTAKEYLNSAALTDPTVVTRNAYDFRLGLTFTWMRKWSSKRTLYLSGSGSHYKINNIMTKELEEYHFQDFVEQPGNKLAVENDQLVYVGNYFQQNTQNFKAEMVYFLIKDITGISASYSKTLGHFESSNWKLGIPISLKDKDQKPTVNFELQWKESYGQHLVGISIGYNFGKLIE